MMTPNSLASRGAAFGLLALILVAILGLGVMPYISTLKTVQAQNAQMRETTMRFEAEAARLRVHDGQSTVPNSTLETVLFEGTSESAAAATMQARVKAAFAAHGATLRRVQYLPVREEDGEKRLGLKLSSQLGLEALRGTLHMLETQTPFIFIESLDIARKNRPTARLVEDEDRLLNVEMHVFGYWNAAKPPA